MSMKIFENIVLTKPQIGILLSVSFCMALAMVVGFMYTKKT